MSDRNISFTLDDASLLRAIRIFEGTEGSDNTTTIRRTLIDTEHFEILKTNDHLRSLLRTFLEANICVARKYTEISQFRARSIISRFVNNSKRKTLEEELISLKGEALEAFKPYEMLRKLTDADNGLLKRVPMR